MVGEHVQEHNQEYQKAGVNVRIKAPLGHVALLNEDKKLSLIRHI